MKALKAAVQFSSVQSLSRVQLFATPWTTACRASLSVFKLMSIESAMPSNHLILCHPLLLPPSIFPSIRVFSKESVLRIRWPKYWDSASASVFPMNIQNWFPLGLTGLISLQSKGLSSVFSRTTVEKHQFFGAQVFFMVQLSHPYMTAEKTIALTMWTFVSKVMSLLLKTLSLTQLFFQGASVS